MCPVSSLIQFGEHYILGQNFPKINIKIIISMEQCTPVQNFIQSKKLQILEPNLYENTWLTKILKI